MGEARAIYAGTLAELLPEPEGVSIYGVDITEVKIADPGSGEAVPTGRTGEIHTRGYHVMAGYFDDPEATAASLDGDGWLRTGDLGSMDERGYMSDVQRARARFDDRA